MKIRVPTPGDLRVLVTMRAALWPESPEREHLAEVRALLAGSPLTNTRLAVFVAEDSAALIGFIEVGIRSHADGCDAQVPVGYVEGWYVAPGHRRRGVARALLAAAEDWSRGQGCMEIASDTWIDATDSQRTHMALGFEEVDRTVNYRKRL